jgi:hypothetical protein
MSKYIIGHGSEMTDMPLSFFEGLSILKEDLIGDTYFIRFENGDSEMTISIHQKEYGRVKIDLRDKKIEDIINKKESQ